MSTASAVSQKFKLATAPLWTNGGTHRDVHYGTFRSSGTFQNPYFKSRISNLILE